MEGRIMRLRQWAGIGLILWSAAVTAADQTPAPTQDESPFTVTLQKNIIEDQVHYQLLILADTNRVNIASTTVVAHVRSSSGFNAVHTLSLDKDKRWQLTVSPKEPARYRIDLEVSGQSPNHEPLRQRLDTQYFQFPEPGDPYVSPEERALAALKQGLETELEEAQLTSGSELKPGEIPSTAPPSASENAMQSVTKVLVYGSVFAANLVVLALIAFGYQMFKNSQKDEDLEDMGDAEGPEPESEQSRAPPLPMQDIDSDDEDLPGPSEHEPPEATVQGESTIKEESTTKEESTASADPEYSDDEEPLFPLDDDDWATTEPDGEESDSPPETDDDKR
jgi:hypothetical protein